MIQEAIGRILEGENLSRTEAYNIMSAIMNGEATDAQIAAFLVGEKLKGESYQEVAGFATAMREKATPVPIQSNTAIDIVGTGGDGAHTFNISTVSAFVIAAAGVTVAKHGNRSVSSKCGSADVLALLGVRIDLSAEQMSKCIDQVGIGFMFAPVLHKAMKYAIGPRREIGVRTVFNILGPLTNPAGVKRQLTGAFDPQVARLMAEVFRELAAEHVLVVYSEDGLDEISIYAPTKAFEVRDGKIAERTLQPSDFGLIQSRQSGALGGTPEENAEMAKHVLGGNHGQERDFVVANAAAGLYVGGAAQNMSDAAKLAAVAIDSGAALKKLESLAEFSQSFSE